MEISNLVVNKDTYKKLINSERLIKDAEHLMNSSYWIDQLKNNKASGIGNQLVFKLNESQKFVGDFIQFCINVKKMHVKELVNNYNFNISLESLVGIESSKNYLKLPIEFLVEIVYLSLLENQDFIGNLNQIILKITNWFPILKHLVKQHLNQIIVTILNTTPCFKRLVNFDKLTDHSNKMEIRRPIILAKRQYIWSVNLNYLKYFARYFFKCGEKYKNFESDATDFISFDQSEIPTCSIQTNSIDLEIPIQNLNEINQLGKYNFNSSLVMNLYQTWRARIEQLKLLIQLKHNNNGFKWCESILNSQNRTKTVDFMQKTKINRIHELSLKSKIINSRKQNINPRVKEFKHVSEPVTTIVQLTNTLTDFNSNQTDQGINEFNLSLNSTSSDNSYDNQSQHYTYFNLLSIPTLIIDPSSANNQVNSVEHFLNNQDDDEDLRVVVTNDLSSITEHDKFIYF